MENNVLEAYAVRVEEALGKIIPINGHVNEAMRYSLLGGGKRIRAALVLEFASLFNAQDIAMPFACAVEMIHAYSLIHDDLPCMDNDDFRRGKLSCHKKFGEDCALLAGDALLTLAFETIITAQLSDAIKAKAVYILSQAAGYNGMVGGQMLDLEAENHTISLEELQQLYKMKTGALLQASALLGCIAGNANTEMENIAADYGDALGMLLQITDDILDVTGSVEKLGKPIGSDAENKKTTYVSIFGLEGAKHQTQNYIAICKQAEKHMHSEFLLWLIDMVCTRDH